MTAGWCWLGIALPMTSSWLVILGGTDIGHRSSLTSSPPTMGVRSRIRSLGGKPLLAPEQDAPPPAAGCAEATSRSSWAPNSCPRALPYDHVSREWLLASPRLGILGGSADDPGSTRGFSLVTGSPTPGASCGTRTFSRTRSADRPPSPGVRNSLPAGPAIGVPARMVRALRQGHDGRASRTSPRSSQCPRLTTVALPSRTRARWLGPLIGMTVVLALVTLALEQAQRDAAFVRDQSRGGR
jgi:hypothetical protein